LLYKAVFIIWCRERPAQMPSYCRPFRFYKHLHNVRIQNPVWHELGWVYKCISMYIVASSCLLFLHAAIVCRMYLGRCRFDDIGQSLKVQLLSPLVCVLRGTPSTETCCTQHKDSNDCFSCFYC
jgi:hypothetical protein